MVARQDLPLTTSIVGQEPEISSWQQRFLQLLPRIRSQAQSRFRHFPPEAREEATAEVIASALVSYGRLVALGQEDRAFATTLVRYAVAQFRAGRRVGSRMNVRDLTSDLCRQTNGVSVEQLDHFDKPADEWQEIVVEDKHSGPAEVAMLRIDFSTWLEMLPERTRHVAETLATGEATSQVARMFGCSASRISQHRRELRDGWLAFTGEVVPATSSALA
jgi:transposase-like protein